MSETDELDVLLDEVRRSSEEIEHLKDSLKQHYAMNPELSAAGLESALLYWEQHKLNAERKLRRFR